MQNKEKTQPKIFHIHIDAKEMDEVIYNYAVNKLGFIDSDFDGHLRKFDYNLPNKHLTFKTKKTDLYKEVWFDIETKCNEGHYIGFLEGEFIPSDDLLDYKPFTGADLPFKITRRKLDPFKNEEFRQTEIHITFKKEESSQELIDKLMDSGFYGINIPKKDGMFVCFTAQGYIKPILKLKKSIKKYLEENGGAHRCTIKEERTMNYSLYSIGSEDLMEIVDHVEYL